MTGGLDTTTSLAHDLHAFDASTGKAAWPAFRAPTGKALLIGAVADELVFAESTDGTMYVVDAATGSLDWRADIHSTLAPSAGVVAGTIYVTSDDRKIHVFDIASHQEWGGPWPFALDGALGSPTIVDGRVFVGTSYGEVFSITGAGSPSSAPTSPLAAVGRAITEVKPPTKHLLRKQTLCRLSYSRSAGPESSGWARTTATGPVARGA